MGSILNFVFSCSNKNELTSGVLASPYYNGINHCPNGKRYFHSSAIRGVVLQNEHSISFNDEPREGFNNVYLLEVQSQLRDLMGTGWKGDYDFSKSILHKLSDTLIENIRNRKIKLMIASISEATPHLDDFLIEFKKLIDKFNLPYDGFIFIDSNKVVLELNSQFDKSIFYYVPHFIHDCADAVLMIESDVNYVNELNYKPSVLSESEILKKEERDYYFLSLNRSNWKIHRTILGCYLFEKQYDTVLWSYLTKSSSKYQGEWNDLDYFSEWTKYQQNVVKNNIENLDKSVPIQIDTNSASNLEGFRTSDTFTEEMTSNCYFQIVSESSFVDKQIFYSEKITKPIIMMQPFILISSPYMLQNLRELGFKTFDGLFDESYDLIEDNYERLQFILNEIDRIANLPKEEIKKLYKIYFHICIYNRKHLMEHFSNKKYYNNKFKEITNEW